MASTHIKQLLFSQYITSGVQVSIGVGAVALGLGTVFGVPTAATAASGALCVSIVDLPGPLRLKTLQLASAAVFTTLITWGIGYAKLNRLTEFAAVIVVSLFAAMLNAFGKRAIALSFVCLFAMVIGVGTPTAPGIELEHTLRFGTGAALYAVYALGMAWLTRYRVKQQVLAEAVSELAQYLDAKAAFFERDADLDQCYSALVAEQVNLVDKQQVARDLVFRQVRGPRHTRLASILIGTLDISERVFSSHTDYKAIHQQFAAEDVTMLVRDLAAKAALDLRRIGYAILRSREARHAVIYKAELIAIAHELARLSGESLNAAQREALEALEGVYERLRAAIDLIEELHDLVRAQPGAAHLPEGLALLPFLSNLSFSPRLLANEFNVTSPVFRFSVRLTLAMATGYGLSQFLPYATHSYWILLTVAVILRANYSVTRQRRNDRILGTLVGCLFIAVLLHFRPGYEAEVVVMLLALGLAHAFATIVYRYTAAAACVMAVLQVHFLNPGAPFAISERLVDTLVGAALAFAFSFVLPSWEHLSMPRMVRELLKSHARYAAVVLSSETSDALYRLARKNLFDAIALTSAAFRRMLLEPRAQRRDVAELNDFITTSYTFASNMAALRLLLENDHDHASGAVADRLQRSAAVLDQIFRRATSTAPETLETLEAAGVMDEPAAAPIVDQLAHPQTALVKRIEVITTQALRLVALAAAMGAHQVDVNARPASVAEPAAQRA